MTGFEIAIFNPSSFDQIVPRRVQLKRVEVDPTLLKEESQVTPLLDPVEVTLQENMPISDQSSTIQESKPSELKIDEILEEKPNQLLEKALISKVERESQQLSIEWDQSQRQETVSLQHVASQQPTSLGNYSQLDQLLEQKAPLTSKTAPILLPTDLLFEYNMDQLKKDAEKSLEKLALLIKRNPTSQFSIEGFTDSFGSEKYNLDLSQRRAESIKKWLLSHQLIDGSKIKTKGFGKTHFLVPSSGTIEQQRFNRRVEIVIHQ